MLQAQQQLLVQNSNQLLMQIRQMELNYLYNFYSQFNTLAGLLAGFQLVSLTQVIVQEYDVPRFIKTTYWVTTAGTFCPSLHCVLVTAFLIVYGPNLAIRGPIGSMKVAIDMMVKEQHEVFVSFIWTLVIFTVSVTVTFWLEAYYFEAYICTAIMTVGAVLQYHYCLRIYNRFQFDGMFVDHWEKNENERKLDDDSDLSNNFRGSFDSSVHGHSQHSINEVNARSREEDTVDNGSTSSRRSRNSAAKEREQERKGILNQLLDKSHAVKIFKQGYISLRSSQVSLLWTRYYFVLKGTNMWYYKDRSAFEEEPTNSLIARPIDLMHYTPQLISSTPPYRFALNVNAVGLQAKVKDWEFTVDTEDELQSWIQALTVAATTVYEGNMKKDNSSIVIGSATAQKSIR